MMYTYVYIATSNLCGVFKDESGLPEVTGVSPNEGPVGGGQRVVLRGSCLGESRADVMQVLVAGVDCTSQLEYFSPCEVNLLTPMVHIIMAVSHVAKLAVMTAPRTAPGSGPVVVQTHSGGVGVSWINFTFVEASECMADSPHQGRRNKNGGNESLPVTPLYLQIMT